MSDLPEGWEWTTFGEIAALSLGKMLDQKQATGKHGTPYLRNSNVRWGSFDLHDLAVMDIKPEELERVLARPGDLIVCEGGEPGRSAVWHGPNSVAIQKALHRVRPMAGVSPHFLSYLLMFQAWTGSLAESFTGTTIKHLPKTKLREVAVPLPPLAEQERVVAAIEEHFSHLDAAEVSLATAMTRCDVLASSVLVDVVPNSSQYGWKMATIAEAGRCNLGRQRSPQYHHGENMRPYLRVANVFEDRIDTSDIMEMDFDDDAWRKFKLKEGDILLNEGQSPHLVGRPAMYRGDPPAVAFTNSLIRFTANPDVDPEFALLVFRRHLHSRRFMKEARITTNIAHLALGRFKEVEFPVGPLEGQREVVRRAKDELEGIEQLRSAVEQAWSSVRALRRSILAAAFAGELVPQDPDDEPASALLDRIRGSQPAAKARKPRKKTSV